VAPFKLQRGAAVKKEGARHPRMLRVPQLRGDSDSAVKACPVSGEIHRLRDMANEWPILVRVTTANAMVLGTVDPQQKTDDGSS